MRSRQGERRTQHIRRLEGSSERDVRSLGERRFSARPTRPGDQPAGALLGDILDADLDRRAGLDALRDWVRRALRSAKLRDSVSDAKPGALLRRRARVRIDYRARKHARKLSHGAIHLDD
jgi:hypothetical protein